MTPPARFTFRLQSVLDLREAREQSVATRLAAAAQSARDAQDAADALARVRESCADDLTSAQTGAIDVGTLRNLAFVLEQVDAQLGTAGARAADAERMVGEVRGELAKAARERAAIEMLRDRHEGEWKHEVKQLDRRTMDDIAITRFVRTDDHQHASSRNPR